VPTYQYACTDCAERSEVVQKFTDEPLLVCSTCGGRLRKVFSPVGIVFKGSGFYRTDSRAGAKKEKEKALNGSSENGSGSASTSDSGGSSDAKKDSGSSSADKKADKSAAASGSSAGNGSGGSSSSAGSSSSGKSSSSSGSKVA
jgi:putative FmdB family regulatory protein